MSPSRSRNENPGADDQKGPRRRVGGHLAPAGLQHPSDYGCQTEHEIHSTRVIRPVSPDRSSCCNKLTRDLQLNERRLRTKLLHSKKKKLLDVSPWSRGAIRTRGTDAEARLLSARLINIRAAARRFSSAVQVPRGARV